MKGRDCIARSVALGIALAVSVSATAAAKRAPIRGELSEPGYTVIAVATSGKVASDRATHGAFKLRPPAKVATLHLRAADGTYAGPIVVGSREKGRRAILGVEAGARLGAVTLDVVEGYASLAGKAGKAAVDPRFEARAKDGIPIGAGVFGQVRSKPPRDRVPGDTDSDGLPDRLDIDDDGDRILDKLDRSRRKRSPRGAGRSPFGLSGGLDPFGLASGLGVPLEETANVNAGSSDAQIDSVLPEFGYLLMSAPQQGTAELDCSGSNQVPPRPIGLRYCSAGGTGRVEVPPNSGSRVPWPGDPGGRFDPDGDGMGTLDPVQDGPDFRNFGLDHGANSSEIGTGDTLILRLSDGTQLTDVQQFIFATTPALASFVDEAGNRTTVSYPVAPGAPGTTGNGFPVADGPDAGTDVEITITQWPPQRRPTSEAECAHPQPICLANEWIDVGGLDYTVASVEGQRATNDAGWCGQNAFTINDPRLSPGFPDPQGGGFRDLAPALPANPANTFTYKLNLTRCLDAFGISFNGGQTRTFKLEAFTPILGAGSAGVDNAHGIVSFTRQ